MPPLVGAFILPVYWERWTAAQAREKFHALKDFGVNTIVTESTHHRSDLIQLAHSMDLKITGGVACFSAHRTGNQLLKERPELLPILENGQPRPLIEWYIGITPTFADYNAQQLDVIEQMARDHALDTMCLDFIRWPLHWELELRPHAPEPLQSSFDPHTVTQFLAFADLEMPTDKNTTAAQAQWILTHHTPQWTDFKCQVITDFVRQARERIHTHRPDMKLGVYLVPAPEDRRAYLVGQRVRDLSPITDFLAPMVYHPILYRNLDWLNQTINAIVDLAPGKILPVLQVDTAEGEKLGADWGAPISPEEWRQAARQTANRDDLQGVVAFTGTALFEDSRGVILREALPKV